MRAWSGARGIAEDFLTVPAEEFGVWEGVAAAGLFDGPAGERGEVLLAAGGSVEAGGDEDGQVLGDADGAAVEGAVVEAAAGEAVGGSVGASGLVPHDVGGVEAEVGAVEAHAVAAEGAGVAVEVEHFGPEVGVAVAASGGVEIEADSLQDLAVQRFGEVGVEEFAGDLGDEQGIALEGGVDGGREAALDAELQEFAFEGVGVALAAGEFDGVVDLPEAVGLEAPEGVFGVDGLAGRPELLEEAGERFLDFVEGDACGRFAAGWRRGRGGGEGACGAPALRRASTC